MGPSFCWIVIGLMSGAADGRQRRHADFVHDHVLIEIAANSDELAAALARAGVTQLDPLFRHPPRGWRNEAAARAAGLDRFFVARFAAPRDDVELVATGLARLPGVLSCQADCLGEPGETTPNDPDFSKQWSLQSDFVNAPAAWDLGTTSSKIVAVLDSGIDVTHPELVNALWTNPGEIPGNFIDDDGNGYVDDVHGWDFLHGDNTLEDISGHGTHVSGVIGATGNNGIEVAGMCWSVPIMMLKVWERGGGDLTVANAAAALTYAADMGASVAQMAWGFPTEVDALRAAMDYAIAADILPISIPGNTPDDTELWPAAWDDVMGIIATDKLDQRAFFSGYGAWNELSAPGVGIEVVSEAGRPRTAAGTSMASAHVSGAAALLRELNPDLDEQATQIVLQNSAKDLGTPGFDSDFGWGRLDLAAAAQLAVSLHVTPTTAAPGDSVAIALDVPSAPNQLHALFVTRLGRVPGIALSDYDPDDPRVFPLNYDSIFFPFVLGLIPGGDAYFDGFIDCTDDVGHADATLLVPSGPFLLGTDLDFSAALFHVDDLAHVTTMTCTGRLHVQ